MSKRRICYGLKKTSYSLREIASPFSASNSCIWSEKSTFATRCITTPFHSARSLHRHYSTKSTRDSNTDPETSSENSSKLKPRKRRHSLTAAEKQWIEDGELLLEQKKADALGLDHKSRFDWRQRAQYRARTFPADTSQKKEVKKKIRLSPESKALIPGDEFFDEVHSYQARFLPLLEAEEAIEREEIKKRLEILSLQKLQEEGYCLTGLSAFWLSETHFGRPVASFMIGPGVALPQHLFRNGNKILLSRLDPRTDEPMQGSVLASGSSNIKVCFDEEFDISDGVWRMDFDSSGVAYERMRRALDLLHLDPLKHEVSAKNTAKAEVSLLGTHLRDVLLRTFSIYAEFYDPSLGNEHSHLQDPSDNRYVSTDVLEHSGRPSWGENRRYGAFNGDMRIMSWAKRYREKVPLKMIGDPDLRGLNASQTRAIAMMLAERVSLVQGPPGTGKTKTIVEAVKLLKIHFEVVHPLLVCTYTNVAVDNLVEGFVKAGMNPLRIGLDTKIRSNLYEYTLEHNLSLHPMKEKYDRILFRLKEVYEIMLDTRRMIKRTEDMPSFPTPQLELRIVKMKSHLLRLREERKNLKVREIRLQQRMVRDVVDQADVVCTTCLTAGSYYLNVADFPVVFLDEASMSTEPASLIPITKGCQHLALIGDHKQLPPIIQSREAQRGGLDISLFERLTKEGDVPSIMLDTQYRMHPGISRFPSSEFYNYALLDGTVDAQGRVPANLLPPVSSHLSIDPKTGHRPSVIFLDHPGSESLVKRSRVNWTEAYIVCSIVEDLLLHNDQLEGEQIGIIAPYVSQINLLNRLLMREEKLRERYISILGEERAMEMANIEIKTVDGFEGREKEIIIFSTVRNNPGGYIGFLADRRRLNVGLTRAKRALFVVGSMSTLSKGRYGRKFSAEEEDMLVGKGAEAWRRFTQYLTEENLVLSLRGHSLKTVLDLKPEPEHYTLY